MDLSLVYRQFIDDRKRRQAVLSRFETHHVVPRALGGDDSPDNLVRLSPSDHLFAHILLAKIHGGVMAVCVVRMLGMRKYQGRRSRLKYQTLRDEHSRITGERQKGKSVIWTEETRQRALKNSAKTLRTPAHRQRLREQGVQASATEEFRRSRSELMARMNVSDQDFALKKRDSIQRRYRLRRECLELMATRELPPGFSLPHNPQTGGTIEFWVSLHQQLAGDRHAR